MDTNILHSLIEPTVDISAPDNPFRSFWMAGYECSDKLNAFGTRVDLLTATGHLRCVNQDYENLKLFRMKTVREGIRWSQVERRPYEYDWSDVHELIVAAKKNDIQQVWDLCHFGFPDDLSSLHPMFARRFASLCTSFVQFYRSVQPDGLLIVTPINEVSFLSWLGGEVRGTTPFCTGQGWNVKYNLMKAYIEGVEALKEMDPSIRILSTEPLVNIVHSQNATEEEILITRAKNEEQFQVNDILCGRMCPELRGKPEYLDILGYNYYYNNQWVLNGDEYYDWRLKNQDERFLPLHQLLSRAYERYQRPIVITETSHPKEDRPFWIDMIEEECLQVMKLGIPLWGVCWYPVIDRPDWDQANYWHQSGLWDGECKHESIKRELNIPTAGVLLRAQDRLQRFIEISRKQTKRIY